MIKELHLIYEEKEFKKLSNAKEESKINGECSNWEEFIIKRCLKGGLK